MREQSTQWQTYIVYGVVSVLSFLISLVIAEVIYAAIEPEQQKYAFSGQGDLTQYDPVLGWINKPNAHTHLQTSAFNVDVAINSDGMRDDPVGVKTKPRIALLGDSVSWGWGVEHSERFDTLLEKDLDVDILNFSTIGYAPIQYLLMLDKVLSYKPDMVLISFTLHNDFRNISSLEYSTYRPYAEYRKGKFKIKGYPIPDYRKYQAFEKYHQREYLLHYALGRLFYFTVKERFPDAYARLFNTKNKKKPRELGNVKFAPKHIYQSPSPSIVRYAAQVNRLILKQIQRKLKKQKIPLLIMSSVTVRAMDKGHVPEKILARQTRSLKIPFVRTYKQFTKPSLYISDDYHWNISGHKLAATLVKPYLTRQLKRVRQKQPQSLKK